MHFAIYKQFEDLEPRRAAWNNLLKASASNVPFLRFEYLRAWWQTLGGGEWPAGELSIVTAEDASGELIGIAPLFFAPNREGVPALLLLGSIEISDYLDLIARPEHLNAFTAGLVEFLSEPGAPAWQVLDWYNLPENSPTLPALQAAAGGCGWKLRLEALQHCPTIALPGDWETYLAGIDKKQRHEIRRKIRRLEEAGWPARFYIVDEETQLKEEVDAFLDLMAQDPEKLNFLTPAMRLQMQSAFQAAFAAGWLQLAFLEIDGEKAAGYANFDYDNRIWVYNSGLSDTHRELSPGWVLLAYLLQWANAHGRRAFDFMRGDEEYKYRFGAVDHRVVRAQVWR